MDLCASDLRLFFREFNKEKEICSFNFVTKMNCVFV